MIRPEKLWPWALGTVLALTVVGNLWVMRLANSDASFAIEPDYYRKAVNWDSTMAQAERSSALGWTLAVTGLQVESGGAARLSARLSDSAGTPIPDARVSVSATFNARAEQILTADLTSAGGGVYTTELPTRRLGIWELRFTATHGTDHFAATLRYDNARNPGLP